MSTKNHQGEHRREDHDEENKTAADAEGLGGEETGVGVRCERSSCGRGHQRD